MEIEANIYLQFERDNIRYMTITLFLTLGIFTLEDVKK